MAAPRTPKRFLSPNYAAFLEKEGLGVATFMHRFYENEATIPDDEVAFKSLVAFWRRYVAARDTLNDVNDG